MMPATSYFPRRRELSRGLFELILGKGDSINFRDFDPTGISSFTILDIDPAAGADPELPFTVGVSFMTAFSGQVFIDATTVDTDAGPPTVIPLPAGFPMLMSALGGLALLRRKQGRGAAPASR